MMKWIFVFMLVVFSLTVMGQVKPSGGIYTESSLTNAYSGVWAGVSFGKFISVGLSGDVSFAENLAPSFAGVHVYYQIGTVNRMTFGGSIKGGYKFDKDWLVTPAFHLNYRILKDLDAGGYFGLRKTAPILGVQLHYLFKPVRY